MWKLFSVLLLSVSVLNAAESEPFQSQLFFVAVPIHIRFQSDAQKVDEEDVSGTWERKGQFSIAPKFHGESRHLGEGALYDVQGIMRDWGLTLPEGSLAVVAPEAQLLFIRSVPADLILADACLETNIIRPQAISFDVQVTAVGEAQEELRLLSGKAIGTQSGIRTELSSSGGVGERANKVELSVEPVNAPTGTSLRVDLEGSISQGRTQSRIATTLEAEFGKETKTELALGAGTKAILQFKFTQKVLGLPAALESAETKKQAIAGIEADLLDKRPQSR